MKRLFVLLVAGAFLVLAPNVKADLIHHWTFDEDFQDSVGDAEGSPFGTADITDDAKVGDGALIVNGGGDYVEIDDREDLKFTAADSYSVAAWIKPAPGGTNYRGVITKGRDAPPWYGIWIDANDQWLYGVSDSNNLVGPAIAPDEWTHVTIVQDGAENTRYMYVNAVLVGSESPARDAVNTGALAIGGALSVEEWFAGVIDDVRVYDHALSADEIAELTGIIPVLNLTCEKNDTGGVDLTWENNPLADPEKPIRIEVNGTEVASLPGDTTDATVNSGNLSPGFNQICVISQRGTPACCSVLIGIPDMIHYWTFDEDFQDSVGDAEGTPIGNADITDDAKVGDGALIVNGGGDYVDVGDLEDMKFSSFDSYSIAAWVKPAPGGSGWRGIVTKGRDAPPWYGIWINTTDQWYYGVSGANGPVGPTIVPDEWTHVVIVQNGAENRRELYVDGNVVGTGSATNAVNTGNLVFGGALSVNEWFSGVIDDVRVYAAPLGPDEIRIITNIVPITDLTCTAKEEGGAEVTWVNNPFADPAVPIRIEVDGKEVTTVPGDSTSVALGADLLPDGNHSICVINSSVMPVCCGLLIGTPEPIYHWTFDEDYVDSVAGVEGIPMGDTTDITDDAKIGEGALIVSGGGDYVEVPDQENLKFSATDSYTIAVWVKAAEGGFGWHGVVTKGRDLPPWYGIWIDPLSSWYYGASSGSSLTGPAVNFDQWEHVAIVQNGLVNLRQLYVNGELVAEENAGDGVNDSALAIGGALSMEEWFTGTIDDLQIFDAPLNQELIAKVMEGEEPPPPKPRFRRGDVNVDGAVNIADAITVLGHLFAGAPAPSCLDAADANDDGAVNIADAITILGHLFAQAGDLPDPFKECGEDPTEDELDCLSFAPCEEQK